MQNLTAAKQKRVNSLIRRGIQQGWDDDVLTSKIAQTVGLDDRYALAVENYREQLVKNGMPRGRARTLARAYTDRLRRHRANVIARTEVGNAFAEAQRRLWTQAQERGELSAYAVRVTHVHPDCCKTTCRKYNGRRYSLKAGSKGGPPFHPQCRCWEEVEDQGVVKSTAEIVKHLPGLHDQKKHGRKKKWLRFDILDPRKHREYHDEWMNSLFRADLDAWAQNGPASGARTTEGFRQGIHDMAERFPNIALSLTEFQPKHTPPLPRGVIAGVMHSPRGTLLATNDDVLVEYSWKPVLSAARTENRMRYDTGQSGVKFSVADNDLEADPWRYGYATAVHEFGHVVHGFLVSVFGERQGRPVPADSITARMRTDIPDIVPRDILSEYAENNPAERFAEYFTAAILGFLPEDHGALPPFWREGFPAPPRKRVKHSQTGEILVVSKSEQWIADDFDAKSFVWRFARGEGKKMTDSSSVTKGGKKCSVCGKVHRKGRTYGHVCKGRLNWSPKENWVDREGGLPRYIEDIAIALMRDHGYGRSRAISIAISRVKMWAAGGDNVKADTRAKAAAAVAQWTKMKASARAKRAAK